MLVSAFFFYQQQLSAQILPSTLLPGAGSAGRQLVGDAELTNLPAIFSDYSANPDAGTGFSSELAAVIAASDHYNPISIAEDREYMGAILQLSSRFFFTAEAGEQGRDRITVKVRVPNGADIVAFWHTHGREARERRYFSEVDTQLARKWKRPFYLADHTGVLKVFRPEQRVMTARRARSLGLPGKRGFATGQVVADEYGETVQVNTVSKTMLCARD